MQEELRAVIIKELLALEAWADGLGEQCRKTRALLQKEAVSTASAKQQGLSQAELARISMKRRKSVLRSIQKSKNRQ